MRLKRAIAFLGLSIAALALAANGVQGSKGRGAVQNENGLRGTFNYQVNKVTHGQRTEVRGEFHFRAADRQTQRSVDIDMPKATGFAKQGRVAEFGGHARAVFMHGTERIVREGPVRIRVEDLTSPEHPTDHKDMIRVHFEAPRVNFTFDFGGRVVEGDLVVFERPGN